MRAYAGTERPQQTEAVVELVLGIFDRYPVPSALGEPTWRELRAELVQRLRLIGFHAPKRAIDIPEQHVNTYFDLMPIYEKLRRPDYPTIRNYLRITMVNIHDELTKRLEGAAVAQSLRIREVAAN